MKKFKKWLETPRPDRPFTVAADSREEAVAFLACLLRHEDVPDRDHDRAVVFKSASPLRTLASSSSPFLPIVYSEKTEREIATCTGSVIASSYGRATRSIGIPTLLSNCSVMRCVYRSP